MAGRIEDYAVIGNCETIALVGRDGSIDWLGLPRFDSAACFAALLGDAENGRWLIAPADPGARATRRYVGKTLILETTFWQEPDDGIWEVRGGRKHFTHSKVMAWVAFDRAVRSAEQFGLEAPLDEWRRIRDAIHEQVCQQGFDPEQNSFVQFYGSTALDASLLLIPIVGFLPADDARVQGTLAAIERGLVRDGFVMRYQTEGGTDGLPPGEGAFLACSFWLVDNYVLQNRYREARALFIRLLSLCNDVGLLAEEYDSASRRQVGNFPQAFSHLALINSARNLTAAAGPAHKRSGGTSQTRNASTSNDPG
jgi:GH15 family glucan-1,4-alpha-glucosidase